jgi:hypothetical protein
MTAIHLSQITSEVVAEAWPDRHKHHGFLSHDGKSSNVFLHWDWQCQAPS